MAFSDRNLDEKIANIKVALKELGNSLEGGEKSPKNTISFAYAPDKAKSTHRVLRSPEKNDLKLLLEYEKEKNTMLEVRISHKDELLSEMSSLQNELYANIEELQNKVNALKSDLEFFQGKALVTSKEIEEYTVLLQQKDLEISRVLMERDEYIECYHQKDEESKIFFQELNQKEPERGLLNALVKVI